MIVRKVLLAHRNERVKLYVRCTLPKLVGFDFRITRGPPELFRLALKSVELAFIEDEALSNDSRTDRPDHLVHGLAATIQ